MELQRCPAISPKKRLSSTTSTPATTPAASPAATPNAFTVISEVKSILEMELQRCPAISPKKRLSFRQRLLKLREERERSYDGVRRFSQRFKEQLAARGIKLGYINVYGSVMDNFSVWGGPDVGSAPSARNGTLGRTPISGGVQSATSVHGLPRPALAVRNLMEQVVLTYFKYMTWVIENKTSTPAGSATSAHGLPRPALAVRNLMEQVVLTYFKSMTWVIENKTSTPAGKVAVINLKLQDYGKNPSGETEVQFRLTKVTLEPMLRSMTFISQQLSTPANRVAVINLKLQDTKTTTGETEVKFQVSRDTLGSMFRSMAYIREQL